MRPSLRALAAAIATLAAARAAGAAEPPPPAPLVVFYAAPELGPARAAVRGALAGAAQRLGSALIDLSPPEQPPVGAALQLRRAIEAYQDFRYAEALASADAGISEAAATGGLGLSGTDLSDLLIYRALALGERGDAARAWDDFIRAATVDPSRRLDAVRFPPRVIESFARAVQAVAGAPTATLIVDLPPGCQLWLDGRPITGQSSLTTARGEHYVRARCPQRAPYGARILVAEERHRLAPELPAQTAPTDDAIRAAARARGFGSVVAATLSRPGEGATMLLTLRWIDGARTRATVVARLARADRAAPIEDALDRLLAPVAPVAVASTAAPAAPWYRSPWLWGIAGAAVTTAVLIPFAIDQASPSDYDVRPRGDLPP